VTATLQVSDVHLAFGGVHALDGATFDVGEGEIVGLIGPNGAGKTTLFDCISGFQRPDSGRIAYTTVDGDTVDLIDQPPHDRITSGIGRLFQQAKLFPSVQVRDIVRTVQHRRMSVGFFRSLFGVGGAGAEEREVSKRADEALEIVGLAAHADKPAMELSTGMLRLCELAAIVAVRPRLLLLDEPSSGIAQKETEALLPLLRRLRDHLDATVLVIEHDMPLVMGLADRIVAMAGGRVIAQGSPAQVQSHPDVLESYLGTRAGAASNGQRRRRTKVSR
jgi:ABC-type branched-subunit amino acid transport system ATPase component